VPAIGINRLRVRGPPHAAARSAFLIENACRTELRDSECLLLIRRLELGRDSAAPRPADRAVAIRRGYETATRDSRHGAADSAAAANCVWFASRAEARLVLLRLLLSGRRPAGWFWPMAVPGWRGQTLAEWLGEMLAPIAAGQVEADLVEIVAIAVEAGAADLVIEALVCTAPTSAPAATRAQLVRQVAQPEPADASQTGDRRSGIADLRGTMLRLRASLPPRLVRIVESLVRRIGPRSRAATVLLERLLLGASPPLALSRSLLADLVRSYSGLLAEAEPVRLASRGAPGAGRAPPESGIGETTPPRAVPPSGIESAGLDQAARQAGERSDEEASPAAAAGEAQDLEVLPEPRAEIPSAAAGLWLVLPALIRLGFREWLADHPERLADNAGRVLLRTIAMHHRVETEDPVLAPLAIGEDRLVPPEWARLWRTGLDRWLARRAGLKLARLVWKPGWLRMTEERLIVRFPPDAADLRLRRQALDVDPGWTDWLGLSVRYAFAERTEP
jgi:hypothetical protein